MCRLDVSHRARYARVDLKESTMPMRCSQSCSEARGFVWKGYFPLQYVRRASQPKGSHLTWLTLTVILPGI